MGRFAMALAMIGALLVLDGCTRGKHKDRTPAVLRLYQKEDVKSWDPSQAIDRATCEVLPNLYETLYQYSYVSSDYQLEPLLAAGPPRFSQDGLTLRIPLLRGVRFQDDPCFKASQGKGRELRAEDFVFAFKRLALPSIQSQGWAHLDGRIVGINSFREKLLQASPDQVKAVFQEPIEGLSAQDDWTLEFKLTRPDPKFLYFLAMTLAAPVPWEAIEAYGDAAGLVSSHPVGTGAFVLTKWDPQHEITLDHNLNFRGEKFSAEVDAVYRRLGFGEDSGKPMPFLNQVVLKTLRDPSLRWSGFLKGEVDLVDIPSEMFKQVLVDGVNLTPDLVKKGVRLSAETGIVTHFVGVNFKDPILGANKGLRQALSAALNRDEWVNSYAEGRGAKMLALVPPSVPDHPMRSALKYDFNLDRAKELLKGAGFPEGAGLMPLKLDLKGDTAEEKRFGEFLKGQWEKIGIKVEVIPNSFSAFLDKMKAGQLQLYLGAWAMDFPDAMSMYQIFAGQFENKLYGKTLFEASGLTQGKRRSELIQKLEDLLQEDCPWLYGYFGTSYFVTQPWLLNYRASDVILNKLKYLRISGDLKSRYSE